MNFVRLLLYLNDGLRRLNWDNKKLETYQNKRLRAIVKHAYDSVPFYRRKFSETGITPNDIVGADDLHKLPIIRKDDLRHQDHSSLISSLVDPNRLSIVRTTGSTGKPIQVYLNSPESDWRRAIYMRANIAVGQRIRDKWVAVTQPSHVACTAVQRRFKIYAQLCVDLNNPIDKQISEVDKLKPDILDGYSMWLYTLAKEAEDRSIDSIRPRMVFGSSEYVDDRCVKKIEQIFNAPFYDQFGCSEVNRTAWQCPSKMGYHLDMDSVLTEFVDCRGEPVSDGERGEILYTSLFNYSMPLIRYAVGDLGVPSNERCSCGAALPLMKSVEGRTDSLLKLPNGRLLSPRIFSGAIDKFEYFSELDEYKLVQRETDELKLFVVLKSTRIDKEELRIKIVDYMSRAMNISPQDVRLDVEFVDSIELGAGGKHRAIVCEIN